MVFSRDMKNRVSGPTGCATTRPALSLTKSRHSTATATLVHTPAAPAPKLDPTDRTRATWRAAYAMARRMIRQRPGRSTGEALTWYLDHGFRRLGFNALPIVRAAGWAVFNQVHVTKAATGTPAELARQGMLDRCVRLERAPRGGWSWAWTHDRLAAVNLN